MIRKLIFLGGLFLLASSPVFAETKSVVIEPEAEALLAAIPVQHGGRIKPFESYAQETLLYIVKRSQIRGETATTTLFKWMSAPEVWYRQPTLKVSSPELQKEFGLRVIDHKISAENVLELKGFSDLIKKAERKKQMGDKLTQLEQNRQDLYSAAQYLSAVLHQDVPGLLAQSGAGQGWMPLNVLSSLSEAPFLASLYPAESVKRFNEAEQKLFEAFQKGGPVTADLAKQFTQALRGLTESQQAVLDQGLLDKEMMYLRLRPFHWSWIAYLMAFLLFLFHHNAVPKKNNKSVFTLWTVLGLFAIVAGILLHTYGMYLRVVIAGRPPVSNMYESMSWVSWVAAVFALIYFAASRSYFVLIGAAPVAALILLLAEKFPVVFSPAIDTLVPVLRSNLWLTVHVLTITMSYGAFALAWGLGHYIIWTAVRRADARTELAKNTQVLHRILLVGVVLLAAGTILGGVWANYSWGRFWGWDPKETWALIALLGYLAILHGRFAGWMRDFGLAAGSVVAFLGIVMAWYGVNYVLAAGLHSYGFGGGGAVYVLWASLADLIFVAACALIYRNKRRPQPA